MCHKATWAVVATLMIDFTDRLLSDRGRLYGLISCCCPSLLINFKDVVIPLAPIAT
jgi:hypothetical protein